MFQPVKSTSRRSIADADQFSEAEQAGRDEDRPERISMYYRRGGVVRRAWRCHGRRPVCLAVTERSDQSGTKSSIRIERSLTVSNVVVLPMSGG